MAKITMRSNPAGASLLTVFLLTAGTLVYPAETPKPRMVTVNADGSFTPKFLLIHDGDTVEWQLSNVTDSIIPVDAEGVHDTCSAYKPYRPNGTNEFTGPLPRLPSGLFTLGPDGPGFVVKSGEAQCAADTCKAAAVGEGATSQCLCETGEPFATMDTTWGDPDVTGVFIRLQWKDVHKGPGQFDWTAMDREIGKAVRHGKLYSLAFKAGRLGTPEWIFNPPILSPVASSETGSRTTAKVPASVRRIEFQDHGSGSENDVGEGGCGAVLHLGSPADETYRTYYFQLLAAAADRIRARNAWYRALAYIKPSGINLFSHENRAPKNCTEGCRICNTQKWAREGDYKPSALYAFYEEQNRILADRLEGILPDKDLSYMLIQDGFPLVNEDGEYLGQRAPLVNELPEPTEQTKHVIADGVGKYGTRFAVQHNGLHAMCGDRDGNGKDECLPNYMAVAQGRQGQIIGFQTTNASKVGNSIQLEAAFQNGYCNSLATFFELYEQRLWETRIKTGGVLDSGALGSEVPGCRLAFPSDRSFTHWAAMLHDRRRVRGADLNLPDPFPMTHRHTFKRTTTADVQAFTYVHGSKCSTGKYGVVTIVPRIVSIQSGTSSITRVAGYDQIGPTQKPTLATVHSLPAATTNDAMALNGISLSKAADKSCALSLSLRAFPGQTEKDTSLGLNAQLSGSSICQSPTLVGTAEFDDKQRFVHGIRVCTSGTIPQVNGIEIYSATVSENGTVSSGAQATEKFVANGCKTWSPPRFCPAHNVAVGVRSYFTDGAGFSGIALVCRALQAL